MKQCGRCGSYKPKSNFCKDINRVDGLEPTCKECRHVYYLTHREHIINKSHRYYNTNRVRIIKQDVIKRLPSRDHIRGVVKLDSTNAYGIISEYIVETILHDTINMNDNNFHSTYDLMSQSLGKVDVKSSKLYIRLPRKAWHFAKKPASKIPDNYVCLAFDESRTKIMHVWVIPGNSNIVKNHGVWISEGNIKRVNQYEIESAPYNNVYQNLNVYELPEFANLRC